MLDVSYFLPLRRLLLTDTLASPKHMLADAVAIIGTMVRDSKLINGKRRLMGIIIIS